MSNYIAHFWEINRTKYGRIINHRGQRSRVNVSLCPLVLCGFFVALRPPYPARTRIVSRGSSAAGCPCADRGARRAGVAGCAVYGSERRGTADAVRPRYVDISNLPAPDRHRTSTSVSQGRIGADRVKDITEVECVALAIRADEAQLNELVRRPTSSSTAATIRDALCCQSRLIAQRKPWCRRGDPVLRQVAVFDIAATRRASGGGLLNCLFRGQSGSRVALCDTGVFAPLVGIVGSLQAAEA